MNAGISNKSEHSRITVGIVTYNSADHIGPCLESIAEHMRDAIPTVIILDNASGDKTLQVLKGIRNKYPFYLEIIEAPINRGYAWGVNRIAELAQTEWLCFINPDARLLTPAFIHATTMARRVPTCGVIGGIVLDPEGNPQECGGVFPTPTMAVWDWCGLRHILPRSKWSTTLKLNLSEDARPRLIDYPTGAFWILRREVYQRVGPFDESFFMYFEETDFCKRANEKSWPSFIIPGIRVEHHRGGSIKTITGTNKSDSSDENQSESGAVHNDPLTIYFESLHKYLYKHFAAWRVNSALRAVHDFLKFRKWLKKDLKSERILSAFETGRTKAMDYIATMCQ